jgi:tetratricopeptide (TPR) repeat protein
MLNESINSAINLLKEKQYKVADQAIDNLIATDPKNLNYLFLKGRSLHLQKKYDAALKIYFFLLKNNPQNINLLSSVCDVALHCGMIGVALASISKAIKINPNNINFYKNKIAIQERVFKEYKNKSIIKYDIDSKFPKPLKSSPEVLILCGGEASRWKSHLGIKHKHLIPIEGEILLERTLKQVSKYSPKKVTVLSRPGEVSIFKKYCYEGFFVEGIDLPSGVETPAWKYLSSEKYWNKDGVTISLLGDVWFSDHAIEKIFNESAEDWLAFGRSTKSELTGCPYGEIFAHKFFNVEKHSRTLKLLDELYHAKLCTAHASGWALSQLISNEDPNLRTVGSNFVEINDFTEDFDFPEDYERWIANRHKTTLS